MADILSWSGGDTWGAEFWATPLGLFTLIAILFGAAHHLVCRTVCDGLLDRLYYWVCLMGSGATLYHVYKGVPPHNVVKTLMVAMAVRFVCVVILHHYENYIGKQRRRPHV